MKRRELEINVFANLVIENPLDNLTGSPRELSCEVAKRRAAGVR
jgi:hypothetical protein